MPIRINEEMPVVSKLQAENIFAMPESRAATQDIRQLRLIIVNIMPDKQGTELKLLRLLSNSPLQAEVSFLRLESHAYKYIAGEYLQKYYKTFDELKGRYYDGMIITGAPIENLPFEEVDYWKELTEIMEWGKKHVTSTMHICWGAQAGLYYHYGVEKIPFERKLSGVYEHEVQRTTNELVRGFDDSFFVPHSRHTGNRREDMEKIPELEILAASRQAGVYLAASRDKSKVFVFGHPEYEVDTLGKEYFRDVGKGMNPTIPANYYPDNDPTREPKMKWKGHANLLFSNWLNYYVYQVTPYQFDEEK